jgi:chromosome segregation ATPase
MMVGGADDARDGVGVRSTLSDQALGGEVVPLKLEPAGIGHSPQQILEERENAQLRALVAEQRLAEIEAARAAAQDQLQNSPTNEAELSATREKLRARAQVRAAEERAEAVEAELVITREELRCVSAEARRANARFVELQAEFRTTLESTSDQLRESTATTEAELLTIRGELAERIDEARRAQAEIAELRAELNARERAGPELVQSILTAVFGARSSVDEVPNRIKDALAPTADAVARLGDCLDQLTRSPDLARREPTLGVEEA